MSTVAPEQIALSYQDRIKRLREKKVQQTRDKVAENGPMNEDDYGTVLPPKGFEWKPIPSIPKEHLQQ